MPHHMTHEEHKSRHIVLHRHLDELAADFFSQTGKMPSKTSVMDLMRWAYEQTQNPTEK